MAGSDEIDKLRAKEFAWRMSVPGESTQPRAGVPPVAPNPVPPGSGGVRGLLSEDDERDLIDLAHAIACTWAVPEPSAQARATALIARRANTLDFRVASLAAHPRESARLARLIVRHYPRIHGSSRTAAREVLRQLDLSHPETTTLLCELVACGDLALLAAFDFVPDPDDRMFDGETALAIARAMNDCARPESLEIGLELLQLCDLPTEVAPTLRKALAMDRLPLVHMALSLLHDCGGLWATDTEVALEFAVRTQGRWGVGLDDDDDRLRDFIEDLLEALVVAPPDAERVLDLLLTVVDDEQQGRVPFGVPSWGLRAMAIVDPEEAACWIDLRCRDPEEHRRLDALEAVVRLPDALARPRLAAFAADPSGSVVEWARHEWFRRYDARCPVSLRAGVPVDGSTPPSERLDSRIIVLRGRWPSTIARMMDVLFLEGPDREALALLMFALRNSSRWVGGVQRCAARLRRHFGPHALVAMTHLARHIGATAGAEWLGTVARMLRSRALARQVGDEIRSEIIAWIDSDQEPVCAQMVQVLAATKLPPSHAPWLLNLLTSERVDLAAVVTAGKLLERTLSRTALATAVTTVLEACVASRDWPRMERLTRWLWSRRPLRAVALCAQCILDQTVGEDAGAALQSLAAMLSQWNQLDGAWAQRALRRPDQVQFDVAARLPRATTADERSLLRDALASSAREGAPAIEAALALVDSGELRITDRRISTLLAAASPVRQAELLPRLLQRRFPMSRARDVIAKLLQSEDPEIATHAADLASHLDSPRGRALIRNVLPVIGDRTVRLEIQRVLGL